MRDLKVLIFYGGYFSYLSLCFLMCLSGGCLDECWLWTTIETPTDLSMTTGHQASPEGRSSGSEQWLRYYFGTNAFKFYDLRDVLPKFEHTKLHCVGVNSQDTFCASPLDF